MQITIFTTTTCPYCKMLKQYLRANNVKYEEFPVDMDEKNLSKMMEVSDGFLGVPFTIIKKDDGNEEKIVGFDKEKFMRALRIMP